MLEDHDRNTVADYDRIIKKMETEFQKRIFMVSKDYDDTIVKLKETAEEAHRKGGEMEEELLKVAASKEKSLRAEMEYYKGQFPVMSAELDRARACHAATMTMQVGSSRDLHEDPTFEIAMIPLKVVDKMMAGIHKPAMESNCGVTIFMALISVMQNIADHVGRKRDEQKK